MNIPQNLKYAASHEWVEFLSDGTCRVGISDFAQSAMGDIVYVNLPQAGDSAAAGEALCDLESVKAVADVLSPVSGTVSKVNEALNDQPDLLNSAPYDNWIAELTDIAPGAELMDAAAYQAHCEAEEH